MRNHAQIFDFLIYRQLCLWLITQENEWGWKFMVNESWVQQIILGSLLKCKNILMETCMHNCVNDINLE